MEACENRQMLAARQLERRSDLRYSVDEDSVVLFVGHGVPQEARLVDLSQEGCRLRTTEPVLARVRLPVEVFFNVDGISFRFRGVLQWTDGHRLIGIRDVHPPSVGITVDSGSGHIEGLRCAFCWVHESNAEVANRNTVELVIPVVNFERVLEHFLHFP